MLSYKPIISRIVLLAAIAGTASLYMRNKIEKDKAIEKKRMESPFFMEYSKSYAIAKLPFGVYERYEHKGHDGLEECMQIVESFGQVYMDGADGRCDEWADTVINRYKEGVYFSICEDKENPDVYCNNELFERFKRENSIDKIKDSWNEHRYKCEGKCKLPILMGDL